MSNNPVILAQSIISGRLRDQVSGRPVGPVASARLWYRITPGADYRPASLYSKVTPEGLFSFSASNPAPFGYLSPMPDIQFRLEIRAPGYQTLDHEFAIPATRLAPEEADITLLGDTHTVLRITGPETDLTLELAPHPLRLTGQVLIDGDPDTPLAGGEVAVTAPESRPAVITDEQGFFAINDLPLAGKVTLTLSQGGEDREREIILDYRQPANNRRLIF
jgi:hypothetical protein